jgi:hypothetical protein
MSLNDGVLSAVVWPTFVGVLDVLGAEPVEDYRRGQIYWATAEDGVIYGRAQILVPGGFYTHLAYYHHPVSLFMVGHQVIDHPFDFRVPGQIDLDRITEADFTQLPTPTGFVLPLAGR